MSVSVFPLYRRRDVVDEVIRGLSVPEPEDAQRFWREKTDTLLRELVGTGVSIEAAKNELRMLLRAAYDELRRPPSAGAGG